MLWCPEDSLWHSVAWPRVRHGTGCHRRPEVNTSREGLRRRQAARGVVFVLLFLILLTCIF